MRARFPIITVGLCGLLLAGLAGGCQVQMERGGEEGDVRADTPEGPEEERPVPIEVATIDRGAISSYLLTTATLESESTVTVFAEVGGLIEAVQVEEGDRVRPGDVLALIDDRDLKLAYDRAQVALAKVEREYERAQTTFARGLIAPEVFDTNQSQYEQARVDLDQARLNLEHARITAPIGGTVTERQVRRGDHVNAMQQVFAIVDDAEMIATIFLPERNLSALRVGQAVMIEPEYLEGEAIAARIQRISPIVDARSGTVKCTVQITDPPPQLKIGMFVKVKVITEHHPDAVLVPKRAVLYDRGEPFVFRVQDGQAERVALETGLEDSAVFEVMEEVLAAGDRVIVVGQHGLKDQAPVKVVRVDEEPVAEETVVESEDAEAGDAPAQETETSSTEASRASSADTLPA